MPMHFVETMRGTLVDGEGQSHAVSFEVSAEGEGRGRFRLTGLAHAAPWAANAPASGTLVISPTLRFIRYQVRFPAAGATWELRGEKRPTLRAPVASMTTLPVELFDAAGARRATGRMTFALAELPGFLASWLPLVRGPRRRLLARVHAAGGSTA